MNYIIRADYGDGIETIGWDQWSKSDVISEVQRLWRYHRKLVAVYRLEGENFENVTDDMNREAELAAAQAAE